MKTFLKMLLAVIVGYIVLFFLFFLIMAGMASVLTSEEEVSVKPKSVLLIDLSQPIQDRESIPDFNNFISPFGMEKPNFSTPLYSVIRSLEYAATDDKIEGILIDADAFALDLTTAEELRGALTAFKKTSNKFIYAYATMYNQSPYFLASVADSLFLNPGGSFMWYGLSSQLMYKKRLFEKIGVEPQIVRYGKYKSAVEPLIADKMSDANREQIETLLEANMEFLTACVSEARGKTAADFNNFANDKAAANPLEAKKLNFIDGAYYIDQVDSLILARVGTPDKKSPNYIKLPDYVDYAIKKIKPNFKAPKVAVLYAEGTITGSSATENGIGSKGYIKEIKKLREDSTIKAVVLRVNSPGGSALASEEIWRELMLLKRDKKLVISMGHLAASGGYYISCLGDKIYANRTTLTGSIGVFARFFVIKKLLEEKIGLTPQIVKTHKHADLLTALRPMDEQEHEIVKGQIVDIYKLFTQRVADGRGMSVEQVDEIGQGRVWSGMDAEGNGLVNGIGGIKFAIEQAAQLAGLDEFQVREYPHKEKTFIDQMIKRATKDMQIVFPSLASRVPKEAINELEWLSQQQGIRAELPYTINIK